MNVTWEENVFATLEDLDEAGQERAAGVGTMQASGVPVTIVREAEQEADEPELVASGMPNLEELELEVQPPRLA
jgi:hypothetical protein